MRLETVSVLGVPVDNVTGSQVLRFVSDRVQARQCSQIVTVNAEYVMLARRHRDFLRVLRDADLRTPDGAGILWAARRRGARIRHRVGGADLIWSMSAQARSLGHRVFLIGGAPGVSEAAARRLSEAYPGLRIAGTWSGSPHPRDDDRQLDLVRSAQPDILFVAFGAPGQDLWIARLKGELGVPIAIGVGGSFDYLARRAKRAPTWMGQAGLEWLYRLGREPWRWRRMSVLPEFLLLAAARGD